MVLWPFSQRHANKDSELEVKTIANIAHSDFFNLNDAKKLQQDEGDVAYYTSELDRLRIPQRAISKRDARVNNPDVESIQHIVDRFGKQLNHADELMYEKKRKEKWFKLYDYKTDQRYKLWEEDRKKLMDRLQIHWIDQIIDSPFKCMVYLLRINTTVGFCYGVWRTSYLYRSMDKVYAKLSNITLGRLAFHEIVVAITKSSGVSLAGMTGVYLGKALGSLASTAWKGDITTPDRAWWHVTSCALWCGLMSGFSLAMMHHSVLTPKGAVTLISTFGGLGVGVGLYFGYFIYKPFAAQRKHTLYDAHWRPWYERRLKMDGGGNVRGRYV